MAAHVYRLADKTRVPSVSTIIKFIETDHEGLLYWAWQLGADGLTLEEGRQPAADVGTIAHAAVEADLGGHPIDLSEVAEAVRKQVDACLDAWRLWRASVGCKVIASEVSMVSEALRFGGRADHVLVVQDKRVLLDLKTGARLYPKELLQIAGYGLLWNERHPELPIEQYSLLRLGKEDGAFTWHHRPAESMGPVFAAFVACRGMYDLAKAVQRMIR